MAEKKVKTTKRKTSAEQKTTKAKTKTRKKTVARP